jgi:uncharacterized protein involved in exopolysaccharide biosynthesis
MASPATIELIDDSGPGIGLIWDALRRRAWILALAVLIGGAAGYAGSYLMPIIYRAEALVSVTADTGTGSPLGSLSGSVGALASLAGIGGGAGDQARTTHIAMLKSRQFIGAYIAGHDLLPALFPDRWDAQARNWRADGKGPPTVQEGADLFLKKVLSVTEDRRTGLLTLRIDWSDREAIAGWLNGLIADANATARKQAIAQSEEALKHLSSELATVDSVVVRSSISSLVAQQLNRRMLANTRPDYAFEVIDPALTPRPGIRVSPSRVGFAAVGGMVLWMLVSVWAIARERSQYAARNASGRP